MKKIASVSVLLLLALSLSAGVAMAGSDTKSLKCPACGYKFDVEDKG